MKYKTTLTADEISCKLIKLNQLIDWSTDNTALLRNGPKVTDGAVKIDMVY